MGSQNAQKANARDLEEARRAREAREALSRASQAETAGHSAFARAANHLSGADAPKNESGEHDWAEIWGRRLGRSAAVVFALVLIVWLIGHLTR